MTGVLERQLAECLAPGMHVPDALRQLYAWIEERGFFRDHDGVRTGFLCDPGAIEEDDDSRTGGTRIELRAERGATMSRWFGEGQRAVAAAQRICVVAQTGGEGSRAALWLDDAGRQRIVHLGSGSGSLMTCVLADDPVDFLRLLAIGYDEICWDKQYAAPPNADESELFIHPNEPLRAWVRTTFGVTIPRRGLDIVPTPSGMDDAASPDPFWNWVAAQR
ncbi:MAG TPA: hypothetical protein VFO79_04145 [Xanthomonadales bacterium]|nr:hypothetical protein [Xanthomonadales bacterium]